MNPELSIVRQAKVEEVDYSVMKILVLALFSVGASMAMFYELGEYVASFRPIFLWFSLAALFILLVMNIVNVFFIKRRSILFGVAFAEAALPVLFFLSRIKTEVWPLAIGLFLLFSFMGEGMRQGKKYLENSIRIEFFSVARLITPKLMTGALIGVSIVFYMQCFSVGGACVNNVGREFVNQTLSASQPIVNLWIPNVSPSQTVNEFFHQFAASELNSVSARTRNPEFNVRGGVSETPTQIREQAISTFSDELRKTVENKVGTLNSKESVRDEIFRLINEYVNKFSAFARTLMSVGVAVLLFFALKGFGFLIYWFVNLFAFLIYKLLIAANFASMQYETRNREFVILP